MANDLLRDGASNLRSNVGDENASVELSVINSSQAVLGGGAAGARTSNFEVINPFSEGIDKRRLKQLDSYGPKEQVGKGGKRAKNKNKDTNKDETRAPQQKRRSTFVPPPSSPPPNPTIAIPPPPVIDLRKSMVPPPPSSPPPPPPREKLWIKLFDPVSSIKYYQHTQNTSNYVWQRPDDYESD